MIVWLDANHAPVMIVPDWGGGGMNRNLATHRMMFLAHDITGDSRGSCAKGNNWS